MKNKTLLVIILVLAVLLRIGAALYLGDTAVEMPGTADQVSYHNLALRLLDGHGFSFGEPWWPLTRANQPTAHWSYLYTFYVTAVYALFGAHPLVVRLIQAVVVGVAHPLLVYWLGKRVFNPRAGLIAAGLTAVYPYFVYYSAALMTEPFYFVAILVGLCLAILLGERLRGGAAVATVGDDLRVGPPAVAHAGATLREAVVSNTGKLIRLSLGLGLTLAAAVLLRQLFLLFIPVLFVWLWLCNRWRIDRRLVLSAALITGIVVAAIAPFTIYNAQRFNRFVLLNTNAGFAFYWANHPIYGTHFVPILPPEMGNYRDLIPKELRRLDEAALDQALLKEAIKIIAADPGRYVLLSLSRIPPFFMFWPSPDSDLISNISRVGGFGLLLPFMLYGLWRAFRPGTAQERFSLAVPLALLMLFVLFYTTIHVLSWTLVRYRLPIDSIFILLAGVGLDDLGRRVTARMGWKPSLDAQSRSQG